MANFGLSTKGVDKSYSTLDYLSNPLHHISLWELFTQKLWVDRLIEKERFVEAKVKKAMCKGEVCKKNFY